ncbi:MAG: hypothetical protein LBL49_00030 [Clostridiales Family XIII bacterium]|jgi:hypothetical protein|nr:hypothetical protein [Clostridiales Family XIII bacterium]
MKNKIKPLAALAAVLATGLILTAALTACSGLESLDVVGQQSVTSFDEVLKTIPDRIAADEMNVGWALSAPDDSVRFIWSEDFSKSPLHDVMLEFDAEPFIGAGLDPDKLPDNYAFYEGAAMDGAGSKMLMVGTKLGDGKPAYSSDPTALAAYEQIVGKYRDAINYHTSLDHYGVKLGDGNMFEWAKDMQINAYDNSNQDKDIVFVLNPEPLIAAGADPEKIEAWTYAQVAVEENGKTEQVWKLLKPFDLK